MKKCLSVLLCLILTASVVLTGCGSKATSDNEKSTEKLSEIKIGVVAPFSGPTALAGKYLKNGVELAADKINADGGIVVASGEKIPVKFYYEDNEAKPDITTNAYSKLIDDTKVLAIIGPDSSMAILAGGPIAQNAKVPAIGTFSTNVKVTQIGDYIFRACFIDPFQGKVLAKYAAETLKGKKAAILFNNANDFSVGLTDAFEENFTAMGGTIVEKQSYSGSDVKDFNVQLTKIQASEPDVLFMPSLLAEMPLQMQQIKRLGITCPVLSGDAADTPELANMAGKDMIEGLTFTSAFSAESQEPMAVEFVKAYQSKYNEMPNSNAVLAYEATELVLEAIKTAKTVDHQGVRDALAAIKDFKVPSGTISFDENRNPVKGAVILKYEDGVAHYITSVQP